MSRPIPTTGWASTSVSSSPRPNAHCGHDGIVFPGRCGARSYAARRGAVRDRHLHLLRAAQRYEHLKRLDIGYFFYSGTSADRSRESRHTRFMKEILQILPLVGLRAFEFPKAVAAPLASAL